jgi:hypothetical protein
VPRSAGAEFVDNIRSIINSDDTELEQSLRKFGSVEHLPAFKDENGVVIVGHRRLKIAEKQKIEPVIKTLHFGKGDEADAERLPAFSKTTGNAGNFLWRSRQHGSVPVTPE